MEEPHYINELEVNMGFKNIKTTFYTKGEFSKYTNKLPNRGSLNLECKYGSITKEIILPNV